MRSLFDRGFRGLAFQARSILVPPYACPWGSFNCLGKHVLMLTSRCRPRPDPEETRQAKASQPTKISNAAEFTIENGERILQKYCRIQHWSDVKALTASDNLKCTPSLV